jgi:hypothetical protein
LNDIVILIFPSTLIQLNIVFKAIRKIVPQSCRITIDDGLIVCVTDRPVDVAFKLKNLSGVEKIAIAKCVAKEFESLSKSISLVGKEIISPGQKFFVKVKESEGNYTGYASRDVEFASSAMLVKHLARKGALPAKNEQEADKVILTVIGKKFAYVCLEVNKGAGGIPLGLSGSASCPLGEYLSFISCSAAIKAGFKPEIVLFYSNKTELMQNSKLLEGLAVSLGRTRHPITVVPIDIPKIKDINHTFLVKEAVIAKVMIALSGRNIILPYSISIHPIWFIESIVMEALLAGKMPYLPLMFYYDCLSGEGEKTHRYLTLRNVRKRRFLKYSALINESAKSSTNKAKSLRLNVGPNYLHSILDSI